MKMYVSYVIQDEKEHTHRSEILSTQSPPYTYSSDVLVPEVLQWAEKKKQNLKPTEDLVITAIYKV